MYRILILAILGAIAVNCGSVGSTNKKPADKPAAKRSTNEEKAEDSNGNSKGSQRESSDSSKKNSKNKSKAKAPTFDKTYEFTVKARNFKRNGRNLSSDQYIPEVKGKDLEELPLLLYSHGLRMNKKDIASILEVIASKGIHIISVNSPNPDSDQEVREKGKDLISIAEELEAEPSNTILMGKSLGAAAIMHALQESEDDYAGGIAMAPPFFPLKKYNLSPKYPYPRPLTIIHGSLDQLAPYQDVKDFLDGSLDMLDKDDSGADNELVTLETIKAGTHTGFSDKYRNGDVAGTEMTTCIGVNLIVGAGLDCKAPSNPLSVRAQQKKTTTLILNAISRLLD